MDLSRYSLSRDDVRTILRWTRNWIHYGTLALIAVGALVAAVEGVLSK